MMINCAVSRCKSKELRRGMGIFAVFRLFQKTVKQELRYLAKSLNSLCVSELMHKSLIVNIEFNWVEPRNQLGRTAQFNWEDIAQFILTYTNY